MVDFWLCTSSEEMKTYFVGEKEAINTSHSWYWCPIMYRVMVLKIVIDRLQKTSNLERVLVSILLGKLREAARMGYFWYHAALTLHSSESHMITHEAFEHRYIEVKRIAF